MLGMGSGNAVEDHGFSKSARGHGYLNPIAPPPALQTVEIGDKKRYHSFIFPLPSGRTGRPP